MINRGTVVLSKQGHDSGRIYVVMDNFGDFVTCVDGEYRLLNNTKKKRTKHLKSLNISLYELVKKSKLFDYEIKTELNKIKLEFNKLK